MAIMAMTIFTSCERLNEAEDRHEARTLDGNWTGFIDTYYYDRWGLGTYRDSYYDNQSCHKFRRGENYTKDVDFVCWPSNGVTISETATALNFYWTIRFLLRAEG